MPKQMYAIEKGGAKRLEVSWSGMWKNFQVKFDGQVVGTANGSAELKQGLRLDLPDASKLEVKLETGFGNTGLKVYRNGEALPGSAGDPESMIKVAGGVVYFIAGLNLALGVAAYAFDIAFLKENFGISSFVTGAIFAVLGFFTMKRSRVALIIAMVLYALDAVVTFAMTISENHNPNVGMIFVRVFFLMAMWRGVKAMGQLKAKAPLGAAT